MVTARIPLGLAPDLSARLRSIFTNSIHFASSATLQALFVDTRLSPWHDLIPDNTRNRATRVNGLIHTLYDKTNTAGENALVLFLYVLADHTDPSDAQHDTLTALATDLERAIAESPTD